MTVADLIEQLKKFPQDSTVYYEGGDHKDDWRKVQTVSHGEVWEFRGVFIE